MNEQEKGDPLLTALVPPETKVKLYRLRLALLLHCHFCLQRDAQNIAGKACNVWDCESKKSVLKHMRNCTMALHCPYSQCRLSRKIFEHWTNCREQYCSVCFPVNKTIMDDFSKNGEWSPSDKI